MITPSFGFGTDTTHPFSNWAGDIWCRIDDIGVLGKLNFREQCIETANKLKVKYNKKFCILLSGGLDSEIALRSFVSVGADVMAISIDSGVNTYDLNHAKRICTELGVYHHIEKLNLIEYFNSTEFLEVYDQIKFNQFWLYQIFICNNIAINKYNAVPVSGQGEPDFVFDTTQTKCYVEIPRGRVSGWYWAYMNNVTDIVPAFLFVDVDLINSYLFHDEVVRANTTYHNVRSDKSALYWYARHLKQTVYHIEWPELKPRFNVDGNEQLFKEMGSIFSKFPSILSTATALIEIPYN